MRLRSTFSSIHAIGARVLPPRVRFNHLGLTQVVRTVHLENLASKKVLKKSVWTLMLKLSTSEWWLIATSSIRLTLVDRIAVAVEPLGRPVGGFEGISHYPAVIVRPLAVSFDIRALAAERNPLTKFDHVNVFG